MPPPYRTTIASRERNRVHAQKTRLRKKEQMQILQAKAAELKQEQIRLKQVINEKNTATILVRLFANGGFAGESAAAAASATGASAFSLTTSDGSVAAAATTANNGTIGESEDPQVEELLRRSLDDIPDASKIPELPALILPGQHASKKMKASAALASLDSTSTGSGSDSLDGTISINNNSNGSGNNGSNIDYELLGRDRMQCTPEELDLIRRERNRMHAKRTRDRKRIFTEKLAELCRELEDQNLVLHTHLHKLDPDHVIPARSTITALMAGKNGDAAATTTATSSVSTSSLSSPDMQPMSHGDLDDLPTMRWSSTSTTGSNDESSLVPNKRPKTMTTTSGGASLFGHNQQHMILTLLKAAEQELHEISDGGGDGSGDGDDVRKYASHPLPVPSSLSPQESSMPNKQRRHKRRLTSLSVA